MSKNLITSPNLELKKIKYGFFTNEEGYSDAGYLIKNKKTRNINIYSSEQKPEQGFDPADRVLANLQLCYKELGLGENEHSHRFYMTSYYANMGKSAPLIISCDNFEQLQQLKKQAAEHLYYEDDDKTNPKRLGLEPNMREALNKANVAVMKADALIFKGIPNETIAVLGASGDAHPIMMFDDEQQIACYIAGAHSALKQNVLQKAFERMLSMGAKAERIRLVIGPGLGPKSYEFGDNALDYFGLQESDKALTAVVDSSGAKKYLINIKELVVNKLKGLLSSQAISNLEIDTMGFDLYQETPNDSGKSLVRRTTINFSELNKDGILFFGARRSIMEKSNDLMSQNPGVHNTVGRHAAGFLIKGEILQQNNADYWAHLELMRQNYIQKHQSEYALFSEKERYWRTIGKALYIHSISPLNTHTSTRFDFIDSLLELITIPLGAPLFAVASLLQVFYDVTLLAFSLLGLNEKNALEQCGRLKSHSKDLGFGLLATVFMPLSCILSILKLTIGIPAIKLASVCSSKEEIERIGEAEKLSTSLAF